MSETMHGRQACLEREMAALGLCPVRGRPGYRGGGLRVEFAAHYYTSMRFVNPGGVIAQGFDADLGATHDRGRF